MNNPKTRTTLLWIASIFFLLSSLVFLPHVNAFFCLLAGLLLLPVAAVQRFCNKLIPRKGLRQLLIAALVVLSVVTLPGSSKTPPDNAEPAPTITDTAADENEMTAETAAASEAETDTAEVDSPVSEVPENDTSEADTPVADIETSPELPETETTPAPEDTPADSTAPADAPAGTQTSGDTPPQDSAAPAPAGTADATASDDAAPTDTETSSQEAEAISYVLNTSTMKFHYESCRDVERINAENYAAFTGSRDDLIAQGYSACGHCHP